MMATDKLKTSSLALMIACLGLVHLACSDNKQTAPAGPPASSTPTAAKNTGPPTGWIDAVEGLPKVGGAVVVRGWAADPDDGAPVQKVEVRIDDSVVGVAGSLNGARPDVAAAYHRDNWTNSGWRAEVRLSVLAGKHKMTAVAYDSAGAKAELLGSRDIEVSATQ